MTTSLQTPSQISSQRARTVIVGAGPAGYTAAIYAARAGVEPLLVSGLQPGGQLTVTTDVENYPGFADPVQGPWLMEQMAAQAARMGTRILQDLIVGVDFSGPPFHLVTDSGLTLVADSVIIATGAQARWLGLESEDRFRSFGVSACATCDGFFFRGKAVAVVGGGNTAVEEALYLTRHAVRVTVIHRRDHLRAEHILQERLCAHPKIQILWGHVVETVLGTEQPRAVTGLRLRDVESGATTDLAVEGVFIAIGHDPATAAFRDTGLALDRDGYVAVAPGTPFTNIPGVFAAGDVADKTYRQAVTAASAGCMAALEVERFLAQR